MKNTIKLSDVRNAWKNIKGTPCAIVKQIFATIESKETEEAKALCNLLGKKQSVIDMIPTICKAYNVGETVTNKAGKTRVIRFTADMVLRFYTSATNYIIEKEEKEKKAETRAKEQAARAAKKEQEAAEKAAAKAKREEERAQMQAAKEQEKRERAQKRDEERKERAQKKTEQVMKKSTMQPNAPAPAPKPTKKPNGKKGEKVDKAA